MNCERIIHLLDVFAEGELDSSLQRDVEEHLEGCASCGRELSAIRRTIRLLADFGEREAPADFVQQVRHRIETQRRRHLFEQLLPSRPVVKVLAGAACSVLAGFGLWLAVKPFLPGEHPGKEPADESSRLTRIASIPKASEDEYLRASGEELIERGLKSGKKAEVSSEGAMFGIMRDLDTDAAPSMTPPAVPTDTPGGELVGRVMAKAYRNDAARRPRLGISAEDDSLATQDRPGVEEPSLEKRTADRQTALGETSTIVANVPATTFSAAEEETRARGQPMKEVDEAGEPQGAVIGGQSAAGGRPDIGVQHGTERKMLLDDAKRGEEVAKYRWSAQSGTEKTAGGRSGEGDEFTRGKESLTETDHLREVTLNVLEPVDYAIELNGRADNDLKRGSESVTGPIEEQEGIVAGTDSQFLDTGSLRQFLTVNGNIAAGYYYSEEDAPRLVLYVKDRRRARSELEKIVADCKGTIDQVVNGRGDFNRVSGVGVQEKDSFLVKLKSDIYPLFLKKLSGKPVSPDVEAAVAKPAREREAGDEVRWNDMVTTLLIRLVEIREQAPSQQSSPR